MPTEEMQEKPTEAILLDIKASFCNSVVTHNNIVRTVRLSFSGLGTHLFFKGPFRSSSQAATYYYQSNHSKVKAIPLSVTCPRTQQANLPAYLQFSTLTLLNAERQARNCE